MAVQEKLTIVISGSFRKHLDGLQRKIEEFEHSGFQVLSPALSVAINPGEEFVILESDTVADPSKLEQQHLDAIKQASALYLFNPEGYLGDSVNREFGYALALGKPVYGKEEIDDVAWRHFCKVASPGQIRQELLS